MWSQPPSEAVVLRKYLELSYRVFSPLPLSSRGKFKTSRKAPTAAEVQSLLRGSNLEAVRHVNFSVTTPVNTHQLAKSAGWPHQYDPGRIFAQCDTSFISNCKAHGMLCASASTCLVTSALDTTLSATQQGERELASNAWTHKASATAMGSLVMAFLVCGNT